LGILFDSTPSRYPSLRPPFVMLSALGSSPQPLMPPRMPQTPCKLSFHQNLTATSRLRPTTSR